MGADFLWTTTGVPFVEWSGVFKECLTLAMVSDMIITKKGVSTPASEVGGPYGD